MPAARKKFNILTPFRSIRYAMIFWFSLLILLTLLIFSVTSLRYTESTVLNNSIDYTTKLVGQINRDIDSYIGSMENISAMIVGDEDVSAYLFGPKVPDSLVGRENERLYNRIITQFNTILTTREDIANIGVVAGGEKYLINDSGDQINENIDLEQVDWYARAIRTPENVLTASHVQHVIRNNYKWVVTLSKGITKTAPGQGSAVFFIDLNYKLLKDLCEENSLGNNSYVFIIDEAGRIIYHPQQQLLYSGLKKEKIAEVLACDGSYFITDEQETRKLYTIGLSSKTGWRVVGVADFVDLMKNREEAKLQYFYLSALLLLTAIMLAFLLAAAITKPIKLLRDSMKEVEKGNFEKASVRLESEDEIGSLGNSFNMMIKEIRQLMEQNTAVQEQKRKSELKALRSQINPHFLYNTLDSIIWMAEGKKNDEVVLMTAALAKLLRQSISNENERITLEQEMEYTRNYLTILKMRYKGKLEYEIELAEEVRKCEIINLVLQPLVENAVYHGIKYKDGKGKIIISGRGEGHKVLIQVSDDGIGMDAEALAGIMKTRTGEGGGVGLNNVSARLQLYYGKDYGLHLESEPGIGTTVTITIPRQINGGM